MTSANLQKERGFMIYPSGGWRKAMFKAPLYLWRMGLGVLLPRQILVLATTGRKSGLPRHTMVEYSKINGQIYIASGWGKRPQWVKNIEADPVVTVESVNEGVLTGTAHRVTDEDEFRRMWEPMQRSPIWETWLESWDIEPILEDYLAKRDRMVVFAIDVGAVPAPPTLARDLQWIPLLVGGFLLMRLLRFSQRKRRN